MGGVECVADLFTERHDLRDRQRLAFEHVLERVALHSLHDQEGPSLVHAEVVDGADVGMIERRRGTRLARESIERLGRIRRLIRQELQRDQAAELRVFGLIDDAHTPAAEFGKDAVARNHAADHNEQCPGWGGSTAPELYGDNGRRQISGSR